MNKIPSLNQIKSSLIDLVADVAPWLAPTAPAYMVLVNMRDKLSFPEPVAWMVAAAVETLGLASVHTALEFWQWNGEKRKSDDDAPLAIAIGAILFYIIVILTVNAVLDFTNVLFAHILAKALLSLLSLDAALIVALRAGQARRRAEVDSEKAERKAERQKARESSNDATNDEKPENDATNDATVPTFARGYPGYVEYQKWLSDNGRGWPGKAVAAQEMRRSIRQIERYELAEEELTRK